jgi:hypothetical protein
MHASGASCREIADARLDLFWLFESFEAGVRAKCFFRASQNAPVLPGLDPGIHQSS